MTLDLAFIFSSREYALAAVRLRTTLLIENRNIRIIGQFIG